MRLLQVMFGILWVLGYLGNGILFLYIEWSFIRQSFIQIFNPFLQFQVLGVLLTTSLFWVFLTMAIVGHYAMARIERYLEQGAKRTKIDTKTVVPPKPLPNPVNEPETGLVEPQVKLLEWAIQSSQKVRFSYEEQYGERSNCTVTPINLKTVEQTFWLEGYSYQGGAKRTFAVKLMQDLKIVPTNEPNSEVGTSQSAKPTRIKPEVISRRSQTVEETQPIHPSLTQPIPNPVSEYKRDISQEVITRPYINFRIDELERITASEWSNAKGLSEIHYELEFRSRKKALDLRQRIAARLTQLQITNTGSHTSSIDTFTDEEGILTRYGYKVGINGLSERDRRKILDTVFLRPLLQTDNAAYLSEWGKPNSAERLQKLANSIAAFTRLAKGRSRGDFSKAIQDWETDLAYLKRTYYNNRFSFRYPRT